MGHVARADSTRAGRQGGGCAARECLRRRRHRAVPRRLVPGRMVRQAWLVQRDLSRQRRLCRDDRDAAPIVRISSRRAAATAADGESGIAAGAVPFSCPCSPCQTSRGAGPSPGRSECCRDARAAASCSATCGRHCTACFRAPSSSAGPSPGPSPGPRPRGNAGDRCTGGSGTCSFASCSGRRCSLAVRSWWPSAGRWRATQVHAALRYGTG